ncbi:MAG: hypothetical protein BGO76_00425 [Caedibacter sp. 38-128]|nr:hypothetical protein [Holosporales bacterium]OJX02936.1 MAG: hypothetical protein BGO76_00425 [Caedibacter sp. 38-128]
MITIIQNITRLVSLTIILNLYYSANVLASYTLNGAKLEDIFGNETRRTITASSGTDDDTAVIWFDQKAINLRWVKVNINPDELTQMKLEAGDAKYIASTISIICGSYEDEGGLLGAPITQTIQIKSNKFSFNQASFMFKDKASIEAEDTSPSIIRSLALTKKTGAQSILLQGEIDFTKKDGNFTGSTKIPGLLIAGLHALDITLDKTKL